MRISGVPVGKVNDVKLNPDNTVDVAFNVNKRYQLYTSTRAVVRYQNLVGDRYLEITSGPGELRKLPPGSTIPKQNTEPALDLDALLGGLKPVLKGLDGAKINEVSNAVIELLQGQGGALSTLLSTTSAFTENLAARDQLIGDVDQQPQHGARHGRREGRSVQRQCRPTAEADHRARGGPRPDRRRDPTAGVGRRTTSPTCCRSRAGRCRA